MWPYVFNFLEACYIWKIELVQICFENSLFFFSLTLEEEEDVHLAPSSADDAPRNTNVVNASDQNAVPNRPSGRVVGIIKRNWHS